jgi:hypothetical protein
MGPLSFNQSINRHNNNALSIKALGLGFSMNCAIYHGKP